MSIHSEVIDNSPEKKFIEELCTERWAKMKNPCKGCRYRCPLNIDTLRCCIFPTCPRDWPKFEQRS